MRQAFSIQDTVPAICEFIRTPSCVLISRVCRTNRGDYTDSINLVDVQKSLHCRDVIRIYATQINEKDWFTIRKRLKKDRLKELEIKKAEFCSAQLRSWITCYLHLGPIDFKRFTKSKSKLLFFKSQRFLIIKSLSYGNDMLIDTTNFVCSFPCRYSFLYRKGVGFVWWVSWQTLLQVVYRFMCWCKGNSSHLRCSLSRLYILIWRVGFLTSARLGFQHSEGYHFSSFAQYIISHYYKTWWA